MMAGAGIKGGSVYGESDKQAAYVKENPVTLEDTEQWSMGRHLWNNTLAMLGPVL